jgi:heat shock protein HtpX
LTKNLEPDILYTMSSVYSIQRKNSIRTTIVISAFIALTTAVGYIASLYFKNYGFALGAFGLALVQSAIGYFYGGGIALASVGAKQVSDQESPEIHEIVSNLSKIAGIPKPKVFISPDPSANAFACGRDPKHASICLNQGILDLLDKNELEGVIAHELSHIRNRDTLVMTVTMVLASVISIIIDFIFRFGIFGARDEDDLKNPVTYVIMIAVFILAPLLSILMQMAVSRSREFNADATAVTFTRYPEALISALQKLYNQSTATSVQATNMSSLYISPPKRRKMNFLTNDLFSTHPSIEKRIANLRGQTNI